MPVTKPDPQPKLPPDAWGWFYGMGSGRWDNPNNPYALTYRLPQVTERFTQLHDEHGATLCVRHRPFGETPGGPMDWDQAVTIKNDEEWSWLIDQYHEETAKLLDRCPDAIVIDYLGKVEDQLEHRRTEGMYSQLLHRLWGGGQPCLNHKVWLGLDAASGESYPDGSIYHHFMETLAACKREQGCDVVVESLPWVGDTKWAWDQHALCLERFYQRHSKTSVGKVRLKSDTKTTFRVANGHSEKAWNVMRDTGFNPIDDWVNSCHANEHNPVWAMPRYDVKEFIQKWNAKF